MIEQIKLMCEQDREQISQKDETRKDKNEISREKIVMNRSDGCTPKRKSAAKETNAWYLWMILVSSDGF